MSSNRALPPLMLIFLAACEGVAAQREPQSAPPDQGPAPQKDAGQGSAGADSGLPEPTPAADSGASDAGKSSDSGTGTSSDAGACGLAGKYLGDNGIGA